MRKAYEEDRIKEGFATMLGLVNPVYFGIMLANFCRYVAGLVIWTEFQAASVPATLIYASIMLNLKRIKNAAMHSMTASVALQTIVYVAMTMVLFGASVACKDDLLKHRTFLAWLTSTPIISSVGYAPPHVYAVICSFNFLVWLAFHWIVNFWNGPCIAFGFLHCLLTWYLYMCADKRAWKEFETVHALNKDRQYLQAMHATLHSMLASLFDASCTCDESGTVHSRTPQLEDLLVGHGQWDPSLQLSSFAASEEEATRLVHFLEQVSQNECHQAQAIQVSLHTPRSFRSKSSGAIEVKLFGIVLPARAGSPDVPTSERIFIGLQAQDNSSTSVPDVCQEIVWPEKVNLELQPGFLESHDGDGADSTQGSLSYTKAHSSEAGTSKQFQHKPIASGPLSTEDSSTQTEPSPVLCPHCFLPRPSQASTRNQNQSLNQRAQMTKGKKTQIQLNTSNRVQKDFAETSVATLTFSIIEILRATNARGKGCCGYHITLARLAQVVKNISSSRCVHDFAFFIDWQCSNCKAMNSDEEQDDEDDEPPCCAICARPKKKHQLSSSGSSNHGDLEDTS